IPIGTDTVCPTPDVRRQPVLGALPDLSRPHSDLVLTGQSQFGRIRFVAVSQKIRSWLRLPRFLKQAEAPLETAVVHPAQRIADVSSSSLVLLPHGGGVERSPALGHHGP